MSARQQPALPVAWEDWSGFEVEEERIESGALITVHGELDIATVPTLRERLNAAIEAGLTNIVIDLGPVTFMDSVALAAILHTRTVLGDSGRMAVVVAPESYSRLVFEIAGLPACLDMHETLSSALAAVAA
jgi:anti-sigma B factor antagonist